MAATELVVCSHLRLLSYSVIFRQPIFSFKWVEKEVANTYYIATKINYLRNTFHSYAKWLSPTFSKLVKICHSVETGNYSRIMTHVLSLLQF